MAELETNHDQSELEFRELEGQCLKAIREYWQTVYKDDPDGSKGVIAEISGANSMCLFLGMNTDGVWFLQDIDLGEKPPIDLLLYATTFLELSDKQLKRKHYGKKLTELSQSPRAVGIPKMPEHIYNRLYRQLAEDMKSTISTLAREIQEKIQA